MAGIGFELRKVFEKESVYSKIKGTLFATMTTIGPTIIFLFMMIVINYVIDIFKVPESDQIFFSSACLHVFVFAIIVSGGLNTITSRYVSDMIFQKKEQNIPSALFGSMFLSCIAAAVFALIVCIILFVNYSINLGFLCGYYLFTVMISMTYTIMTFVSAIKEYKKITISFFFGMLCGFLIFGLLYFVLHLPILTSIIDCMAIAFLIINVIIVYYILSFFNCSGRDYFAFTAYFKKCPLLFFSGLFYIIGLYSSNIIYWCFSDISIKVTIFRVAPTYDMATFLAILVNLSATVIFTVKVETQFFEKYKRYTTSLVSANYAIIEKARKIMSETINVQLFFLYEAQLIITIILTCLAILFFPMFGLGGLTLDFFLLLGLAMFSIVSMYFTVVFLYYFDDQFGSCVATAIFLGVTSIAAVFALRLGTGYYALAPLAGGLCGLVYAFIRLKHFLQTINVRLFCKDA